jgi:hypothetical protein
MSAKSEGCVVPNTPPHRRPISSAAHRVDQRRLLFHIGHGGIAAAGHVAVDRRSDFPTGAAVAPSVAPTPDDFCWA